MNRSLILMMFMMIGTVLVGSAIIAVLSMGYAKGQPIALAALAGFVVAMPITWAVTRKLTG